MNNSIKPKFCGKCGGQVGTDDCFCPFCGASISTEAYCQSCGTINRDGLAFCKMCGSPLTQERNEIQRTNEKIVSWGKIIGIAAAVVLLIAGSVLSLRTLNANEEIEPITIDAKENSNSIEQGDQLTEETENRQDFEFPALLNGSDEDFLFYFYVYNQEMNESYLIYEKEEAVSYYTVDGYIYDVVFSSARNRVAFCTAANRDFDEPYSLNIGSSNGITLIENDNYVHNFDFSTNGQQLAYVAVVVEQEEIKEVRLVQYNLDTGKRVAEIANEARDVILSPNGNNLLICEVKEVENEKFVYETYLCKKGNKSFVGSHVEPICIADDGSFYCVNENDELFYFDSKGNQTLVGTREPYGDILINNDCSEILFYDNDNVYYAKDGITFSIMKANDFSCSIMGIDYLSAKTTQHWATIYDIDTFKDQFFYYYCETGDGGYRDGPFYMYLDSNLTVCNLDVFNGWRPTISADGKNVYYNGLGENGLEFVKRNTADFSNKKAFSLSHPADIAVLSDGETVYFEEDALWQTTDGVNREKVSDEDVYRVFSTHNDHILFERYVSKSAEGILYHLNEDGGAEKIIDSMYAVHKFPSATICETYNGELYVSTDGEHFELLISRFDDVIQFNG